MTKRLRIGMAGGIVAGALLAVTLHAAGPAMPAAAGTLRVDIVDPVEGTRLPWQSDASYSVVVSYAGKSTKFDELSKSAVVLTARYVDDVSGITAGTARVPPEALVAISQSNCTGCHDFTAKAVGPAYAAIAKRYAGSDAAATLADHILKGSAGVWGTTAMPPHPDMSPAEAGEIAHWILDHANDPGVQYRIGAEGSFRMSAPATPGPHAGIVLEAAYAGPLNGADGRQASSGRSVAVIPGTASAPR